MARKHPEGLARATIYDVARKAGVSSATVSRVFGGDVGKVAGPTREAVLEAAEALRFRPNAVARSLSRRDTDTLAILLPDIANPFFPSLVKELQSKAQQAGFTVMLCNTEDDADIERRYLDMLISKQITYALVIGLQMDAAGLAQYSAAGLTFIALDRAIPSQEAMLVRSDNRRGARMAVQHLIDLGHERIAHIAGPSHLAVSRERRRGYGDALRAAGLDAPPELVVNRPFSDVGGAEALEALLASEVPPTAIFAADDMMAIGAIAAAKERGIRVPTDISVIGFDDVPLARYVSPQLSTVRQDVAAMAEAAVGLILDGAKSPGGGTVTVPVHLEVRQSTSARRKSRR